MGFSSLKVASSWLARIISFLVFLDFKSKLTRRECGEREKRERIELGPEALLDSIGVKEQLTVLRTASEVPSLYFILCHELGLSSTKEKVALLTP